MARKFFFFFVARAGENKSVHGLQNTALGAIFDWKTPGIVLYCTVLDCLIGI